MMLTNRNDKILLIICHFQGAEEVEQPVEKGNTMTQRSANGR